MTTFVDTSALHDLLDAQASHHRQAAAAFERLLDGGDGLVTHNYVLVETAALLQRRLGIDAVRTLQADLLPLLDVQWVDAETHRVALSALLAAAQRTVSLVDWVSFEVMRSRGIASAFAFDADFRRQGFATVP